jgi:hypothetical protein
MVVSLAALWPLPPLLQDQNYHQFADQRELFGVPNFWNVVSNIPFIGVGAAGLLLLRGNAIVVVLFTGLFLTGFGSSYYHLNPNDSTLFWDRLPMTLCFAAILAAVVEERVDARAGVVLLRPLLAIGVFGLLLWRWTDDLRLYAWAQFFPAVVLIFILGLFPPKFSGASYWIFAVAFYALAKLFEFFDEKIFSLGQIVSGHTLKHLAAAAAGFAILRLFQIRRPIPERRDEEPQDPVAAPNAHLGWIIAFGIRCYPCASQYYSCCNRLGRAQSIIRLRPPGEQRRLECAGFEQLSPLMRASSLSRSRRLRTRNRRRRHCGLAD